MISEPVRAFKLDRASLHWLARRPEEPDRSGYEVRRPTVSAALWLAALAGFAALGALRGSWSSTWGDEGTYLAMAESLVLDGDLVFGERDLGRLAGEATAARSTLILQRNERGITYSKPVLYAVLVAPFFRLFGELGPVVFNVLVLALALRLVLAYLRRLGSAEHASFTLVTFAGASILLPYIVWRMSDLLQAALALAGLVLCLAAERGHAREPADGWDRLLEARWAPSVGGLLLGAMVAARFPNLLVALAPVAALGLRRRWRRLSEVGVAVVIGLLLASLVGIGLTGTANPYKEVRASFNRQTGYPVGAQAERAQPEFEVNLKTQQMTWRPKRQPAVTAYATGYFFVGRHTGLLIYFPALLALLVHLLRRPDRLGLALILAATALAIFYLVWQPRNYFGGSSFLGNRYFLSAYPLFLVALPSLPRRRSLIAVWALAAVVFASALASQWRVRSLEPTSQSHAYAGVFRLLPYEATAALIDGRRDRYWLADFVRFVDPYARVEDDGFELTAGSRPAELLHASRRASGHLLFEVTSAAKNLELEFADWRGTKRLAVAAAAPGGRTLVEVEAAPAWRRHAFWWNPDEVFEARVFRLGLRSTDGTKARARVRYAGDAAVLEGMFVPRVLRADLPSEAVAGTETRLRLQLQNMSHYLWRRDGVLAVRLGHRIVPEDAAGPAREGARVRLARDVPSGGVFVAQIDIEWPQEPGAYRLVVDLLVEGAGWFAERVGRPLAQARVELVAPAEG